MGNSVVGRFFAVITTPMAKATITAIAHRGASGWAPENTVAAFDAALDVKCRAIEFDVRLSADGVPIVIHDETLDRTTNGRGRVADACWLDIRRLDAGSWKHRRFAGTRVPALEEALQAISEHARPVIELKVRIDERMLLDLLRRHDVLTQCVVMSFDADVLEALRRESTELRLFLLAENWKPDIAERCRRMSFSGLVMPFAAWALDRALAAGRSVEHTWAYQVNDAAEVAACGAMGIEGVITDYPDLIRPH